MQSRGKYENIMNFSIGYINIDNAINFFLNFIEQHLVKAEFVVLVNIGDD